MRARCRSDSSISSIYWSGCGTCPSQPLSRIAEVWLRKLESKHQLCAGARASASQSRQPGGTERKRLSPLWRCRSRRRRQSRRVSRVWGHRTRRPSRAPGARRIQGNPLQKQNARLSSRQGTLVSPASPESKLTTGSRFGRAPTRGPGRITPHLVRTSLASETSICVLSSTEFC